MMTARGTFIYCIFMLLVHSVAGERVNVTVALYFR